MNELIKIKSALISVYNKDNLEELVRKLDLLKIKIYSTGGTKVFINELGIKVTAVEELTNYPSIFGGRVKTLHPKVFGGILYRRDNAGDLKEAENYEIPPIDLVIVDLYPFEEAVLTDESHENIIEKIDIGGISLIRAAAKNYKDVVIVPSQKEYSKLTEILNEKKGFTSVEDRKSFAASAFNVTSHYDTIIFDFFNKTEKIQVFKESFTSANSLRYGENPHQMGIYFGELNEIFDQLNGKEISYNNLLDIDAAVNLISEFKEPTFAILKHNNACGIASRDSLAGAWHDAFAGDPVSAYGGVLITNTEIDEATAIEINKLFFDIILAPSFVNKSLDLLKSRKNRIILLKKPFKSQDILFKSVLNGVLVQDKDLKTECGEDMKFVTKSKPGKQEIEDLIFAIKVVKHSKSNAIVLVKNKQLIGSGTGQVSRIDALKQAILKAGNFGFNMQGAVMASDAYFPFADCVEIAHKAGIVAVIQPGGSVRDNDSIEYCNENNVSMVFTGVRHFRH